MPASSLLRSPWPPMATAAVAAIAVLVHSGTVPVDLARFAAYVLLGVALPGVFAWRLLLQRLHTGQSDPPTWFEDLSLGSIFGFGIQLPVYLVGVLIGFPLLVLALPCVVLVLSATPFGRRIWTLPTSRLDWRASWALSAIIVYGMALLASKVFWLRPLSLPPYRSPSVDETFHQALVSELSHRVPPQVPYLLDTRLDYHWFVHAQVATTRWVTGVDTVVLLRQLFPALTLTLTVLGLAAVALRLTGRPSAAVVAPALLVVGAYDLLGPHHNLQTFSESFLSERNLGSPSQAYGQMMSMPALMLLLEVLRPKAKAGWLTWVTLATALLALAGSKATFLPIFLAGAIALWLFQLVVNRRIDRSATMVTGMLLAATLFAQIVLFGMQSGNMLVVPFRTVKVALNRQFIEVSTGSVAAMTLTFLVWWLLYGVGAIGLARDGRWRDPRAIWLLVAILAGVAGPFLFYRSGLAQLWFQRSANELVVLLSAWGLAYLLPRPLTRHRAGVLLGIAAASGFAAFLVGALVEARWTPDEHVTLGGLALTVVTVIAIVAALWVVRVIIGRRGGHRPGALIGVTILLGLGLTNVYATVYDVATQRPHELVKYPAMFARGGVEAAQYIRDHSSPDEVVATNAHCLSPTDERCDNRNFWVSAYTERRIVIEGWGYNSLTASFANPAYNNAYIPTPYPERLAMNDAAFQYPSDETVGRLVDTYGVDWLFVSKEYPADIDGLDALPSLLAKRFEGKGYVVYEVIG